MSRRTLFQVYDSVIPIELCNLIIAEGDKLTLQQAGVVSAKSNEVVVENDEKSRKTEIAFWPEDHWINGLIVHYIAMANRDIWQFDITLSQGVQYGVYRDSGFYGWHVDELEWPFPEDYERHEWRGLNRKLSASVNLMDGKLYEGGDLKFKDAWGNEQCADVSRNPGSVIVFPSYVLHTVTPVVKGTRKSLVSWILGPQLT